MSEYEVAIATPDELVPFDYALWAALLEVEPHEDACCILADGYIVGFVWFAFVDAGPTLAGWRGPIIDLVTQLEADTVITTFDGLMDALIFEGTGVRVL